MVVGSDHRTVVAGEEVGWSAMVRGEERRGEERRVGGDKMREKREKMNGGGFILLGFNSRF